MNILKKCLANSIATTLLSVAFFSTVSAAGPVGAPPTQNVSPTFSDVNVLGNLKVVKDLIIGPVADSVFTVGSNFITIGAASGGTDLNIRANINLANDINGGVINNVKKISDNLAKPSKLELISGSASLILNPFAGQNANDFRVQISGKLENAIASTLEIIDNLKVIGQTIVLQDATDPSANLNLTPQGISTGIFNLALNQSSGLGVVTGSTAKKADLTVNGHLRADSVGRYIKTLSGITNIPANAYSPVVSVTCPVNTQIVVSCGFQTYQDITAPAQISLTSLIPQSGSADKCSATFYNSAASTRTVNLHAVCFDPNGI